MRRRPLWLAFVLVAAMAWTLLPLGASAQEADDEHPVFLTGPNEGDPEDIAVDFLRSEASTYGLSEMDVADLDVRSRYASRHNGVTHVNVNQRFRGREVFEADMTLNIAEDGTVVHAGGSPVAGLRAAGDDTPDVSPVEAVEAAADELDLDEPENLRELPQPRTADGPDALLTDGGISEEPIPARLGWQPTEDGLRLAWQVVIHDATDIHLWNATIDAETGDMLKVEDWTSDNNVDELAARLGRGGGSAAAPSSASASASSSAADVRTPNPVEDGSSYRVYDFPVESPNDGDRTLVENPADANASPFGWHDVSGTPQPDYTTTRGNNTHAYTDHNNNGQPDPGGEPDGGPDLTFDFPLDLSQHPHEYSDAAVTNLFFWCNLAHDIFWHYGFDEPSGNFQVNNYGRGGVGGDDVRCEAQDGGGMNNANFLTPAQDGGRPRMQMYLWNVGVSGSANTFTVDPPSEAAGNYEATDANFGPDPSGEFGDIVVVDDGSANPTEGCDPLIGFPPNAIALIDRGTCPFVDKVLNAQAAGAVAVVIANNTAAAPIALGGTSDAVTIPSGMISLADADTIKAGLPATGSFDVNEDLDPLRDGDLEAGIVLHEYSHGVSNRLTGGPGINCLGGTQRMGEGWSDYHGIATLIDPALDDPEGPRGMGTYALWQDEPPRQGPGIRPAPYSRNMDIQPFTYESIGSGAWLNGGTLAAPHGIGHGWAAILWDMTWDLIDKHGFNPNLYEDWSTGGNNLSQQLVMDGLKFQGCNPGFVDGRDAIIAADFVLTEGENFCTLWSGFARRGLGYSAEQAGNLGRNGNVDGFDTHPDCARGFERPVDSSADALNVVEAGSTVPLRFDLGGNQGLDVLASNSPYSRQVDCDTFAVVQEGEHVTPKARPVDAETSGNSSLSANNRGVYNFPWQTAEDWVDTCRELVLTRADGVQHRAFFQFVGG